MYTFTIIILIFFIGVSTLSLLPFEHWFFRTWDFPRLQLILLSIVGLSTSMVISLNHEIDTMLISVTIVSTLFLLYQLYMVFPFTKLAKISVKEVTCVDETAQISLLVSNVLMPNNNTLALLELIQIHQPDVVLTLETDNKWQDALDTLSDAGYHYSVKVPLDNLYGMHLYSRLELKNPSINYFVSNNIPSITTLVTLRNGTDISLYCLHPEPPSPTEATNSKKRDAELLMVAQEINKAIRKSSTSNESLECSYILAGDLNDVAWSKSTKLFQRVSNMLDPRKGRGFFNTFHAKYPVMRWALDHVFVSNDFELVNYERLNSIDSDHFPVLTTLQHIPNQKIQSTTDIQDEVEAMNKIALGLDEANNESDCNSSQAS